MTSTSFRTALKAGLLLAAAGLAITPAAAADKPKQPPMSKDVNKALSDAQKSNAAKDYKTALTSIQAADAMTDKTPYDQLMIDRFMMSTQIQLQDYNAADTAAEAAADLDPAIIPDDTKMAVYKAALQLSLNTKHYDKAAKYAKILLTLTPPPDAATMALIPQALYLGGDAAGASDLATKDIAAAKAAGQIPARNDLDIVMSAQVKAKDEASAEVTLEDLVRYYNDPGDWGQMIGVSFGAKGMREIDYIYLGRLGVLVNAKLTSSDAGLIGNVANGNRMALYGDAEAMQKLGGPAPDPREAADRKSLPEQIKVGQGPKGSGEFNAKLAEALYGYGMYPQAEAAARQAAQKGGAIDPNEPNMVLGMTLAAEGKFPDAKAAFAQVKEAAPASQRVVRLWGYYIDSKLTPATTAPASAQ